MAGSSSTISTRAPVPSLTHRGGQQKDQEGEPFLGVRDVELVQRLDEESIEGQQGGEDGWASRSGVSHVDGARVGERLKAGQAAALRGGQGRLAARRRVV